MGRYNSRRVYGTKPGEGGGNETPGPTNDQTQNNELKNNANKESVNVTDVQIFWTMTPQR